MKIERERYREKEKTGRKRGGERCVEIRRDRERERGACTIAQTLFVRIFIFPLIPLSLGGIYKKISTETGSIHATVVGSSRKA